MSIVALICVLVAFFGTRSLVRLWNRRMEASLEQHLRGARDLTAWRRSEGTRSDAAIDPHRAHADPQPLASEP